MRTSINVVFALAALGGFLLPQSAQAQTAQQIALTISATDRNPTATGTQVWEGDTFTVRVAAGSGISSGTGNVVVTLAVTDGSGEVTTTGGLVFTLNSTTTSITRTWTVTDDATKEGQENFEVRLRPNGINNGGFTGSNFQPTSGGNPTGVIRSFTIESSDRRTINIVVDSTREPADEDERPRFYFVLAAGSDALTGAELPINWAVSIASGQTASAADFSAGTLPSGTYRAPASLSTTTNNNRAIFLNLNDDNALEAAETYTVTITSTDRRVMSGETHLGPAVTATIADNDGYTLTPVAPAAPAQESAAPTWRVRYTADEGSSALAVPATVTATITGAAPGGTNLATGGYPAAITSARTATPADDFAAATATCTIPATTAHNALVDCALPMVTDDTLSERVEHYQVALSGAPIGVTIGAAAHHTIAASDAIGMRITAADFSAAEGSAVSVTVEFSAAAATTPPAGLTQFRLLFDDGDTTYRTETPGGGDTSLISPTPIWARAAGMRSYTFMVPANTADSTAEADEVQTWRLRGTVAAVSWEITGGDSGDDGTFTVTFTDDDAAQWTVRAFPGSFSENVNEDAAAIASPTTVDSGGDRADTMYFYFTNYGDNDTRAAVTVTYCLRGTATGATQAQITADPNLAYDYAYPAGYDPTSTAAAHADYPGSCDETAGRGTFTIAANANPVYRLGIMLNNDGLNEGDETILAEVVNVVETGYPTTLDSSEAIATRTIKDNDPISISIANSGTDADDATTGHQVQEGGNATFTVTLDHAAAGEVVVHYTISGGVVAADYSDDTRTEDDGRLHIAAGQTTGTITIGLVEGDSDTAAEDLTVTLDASGHTAPGTIARSSTAGEQSATQSVTDRPIARTLTLTRFTNADYDTEASGSAVQEDVGMLYFAVGTSVGDTAFSSATAVTWTVTHAATTGTAAADFTAVTGSIMHPAAACSATTAACQFQVAVTDDNFNEDSEGFSVLLSVADEDADDGTGVGSGSGALTITDDDPIVLSITGSTNVQEGGNLVHRVSLGAIPTREIRIQHGAGHFTATAATDDVDAADADFGAPVPADNTIVIAANTDPPVGTLTLPVTADNLNEAAETIVITSAAGNVSGEYGTVAADASATYTIAASNAITATLAAGASTYNEGQTAQFTVTLAGATAGSAAAITVPYVVTFTGAGYTSSDVADGSITIDAGDTSGTIDLALPVSTTLGMSSPDQMLTVTIPAPDPSASPAVAGITVAAGGGSVARDATNNAATVTVDFVDAARTLTVTGPATITEGDAAQESTNYTITLTGTNFTSATTVTWTATNGGTVNADFVDGTDREGTVSFGTADTTQTFTLTVAGDNINEPAEAFTVQVSVLDDTADSGTAYGTAARTEIRDDDPVEITIARHSGCAATVAENVGSCDFTITVAGGSRPANTPDITLPFSVSGTGITAGDYTVTASPVAIAQADASATITVTVTDDDLNEADETLAITGAAVGATGLHFQAADATNNVTPGAIQYTSGGNSASVEITDDDDITVSVANQGADADPAPDGAGGFQVEEGGNAVFRITIDHASSAAVMVPFTITGLDAADVTGGLSAIPTSPATIAAGQTHVDISIPLAEDADTPAGDETSETVTFTLDATGYTAAGSIARASQLSEYSATQNIIPKGAARTLTVTGPATVVENDAGGGMESGTYTITRSGTAFTAASTTVTWTVTHVGTADADFVAPTDRTGTVTFAAADTTRTFTLTVAGDNINEPAEAFTVQVSVADATIDGGTAYGTAARTEIRDDDNLDISVTASGTNVAESAGASPARDVTFTINLGAELSANADIFYYFGLPADIEAASPGAVRASIGARPAGGDESMVAAGADMYIEVPNNADISRTLELRIPAGNDDATITVRVVDDDLNEATETILFGVNPSISGVHGTTTTSGNTETIGLIGSTAVPAALVTITDDDAITYSMTRVGAGAVREGGTVDFTITLSGASAVDLDIPYTVTAAGTYDVSSIASGTQTVAAGMTTATLSLELPGSAALTAGATNQNITVALGSSFAPPAGAGRVTRTTTAAMQSAIVSVQFITATRTLSVTLASSTINENDASGGQASANITIALGTSDTLFPAGNNTVNWEVMHGTTSDADFVNTADLRGTVIFGGTDRSTDTFTIDIAGDNINEANETFTIRAWVTDATANGGTSPGVSAPVTIMDNDQIALGITTGRDTSEGGTFNLTFNFGALASRGITLDYALGRTSDRNDVDAILTGAGQDVADADSGSVTLATTATQVTIDPRITITDDTLNEAAETFVLTIVLADDLSGHHGTAAFTAATTGRTDCTAARCEITYTIAASDLITLSIADAATSPVDEGGTAQFVITLTGAASGSVGAITVPYTVTSSGAYSVPAGSFTIPARTGTTHTVSLPLPNDNDLGAADADQTLTVTLTADNAATTNMDEGPTAAAGGGNVEVSGTSGANNADVDVNFIDAAHTFVLTSPATTITEDDTDVRQMYTITRTGPAITGTLQINWEVTVDGTTETDASAADFDGNARPSGNVQFTGNQTTRTFEVVVEGDNLNEDSEEFTIEFTNGTSTSVTNSNDGVAEPADHDVSITDDDAIRLTTSAANNGRVSEGGNAVVTVNLGAIPSSDITVAYDILNTLATDDVSPIAADYTNTSGGSIIITAADGVATGTITLAITNDDLNESAENFGIRITTAQISGHHGTATTPGGTTLLAGSAAAETLFTIIDGDPITYSIDHAAGQAASIDEGQSAEFTVTLAGATSGSAAAITVPFSVAGLPSGVTATTDPANGMLEIAAGSLTGNITVTVPQSPTLGDTDSDATLRVNLGTSATVASGGGAASLGTPASASVTVDWQSAAHSIALMSPTSRIDEGDSDANTTYTLTRTGPDVVSGMDIVVTWTVTNGTTADADFSSGSAPTGTVTFSGTGTSQTFMVGIEGDTLNEADETFTIAFSIAAANAAAVTANGDANLPANLRVTIADDDDLSVNVAFSDTSVAEDAAAGTSFTITLNGMRSGDVRVPFTMSGLSSGEYAITAQGTPGPSDAVLTIDSGGTSGAVVFESTDSNTHTVDISLTDDDLNEATEMLTVTGGTLEAAGTIAYTTANNGVDSVDVTDTDAITVSIAAPSPATQDEGSTIEFPVSFAGATSGSAAAIDVAYTVAWTATSTGTFTDLDGGSITIPAGQTSGNIRVRVQHSIPLDSNSADETLRVTLGAITVGSGGGSATGSGMADATVNWIDAAHTIEVADVTVNEGAASITVTRSANMDLVQPVDIMWAITHGTTEAADFNGPLMGTVRFSGSQETATIRAPIVDDNLAEMAETFTLTLSENLDEATQTANSVVAADDTATITITDNDAITITIGGQRRISEERTVTFPVMLTAQPTAALSVSWEVAMTGSAGTCTGSETLAAEAGDFTDMAGGTARATFPSGMLNFPIGDTADAITLHTTAGTQATSAADAANANGNWDQSCDRQFTIMLTTTGDGGGSATAMPPMAVTITISEDNPEAIAELNESVLPEVARAVATNQVAAIAERVGAAGGIAGSVPSFNLNGQSSAAGMTAENLRELANDDGLSTKEMLRDMDFVMPLNAAGGLLGENRMALWGGSDYRDFSGQGDSANKPKWDGEMFSLHVGADARVNERLLVGVMLSHSDAESDYSYTDSGRTERGDYDLEMTGFSPYLSWDLGGGSVWASLGYGQGDLTIDPDREGQDTLESDVDMTSFGAGGTRLLRASDAHELNLKADAFMANIDVDGDDDNENLGAIDVDANRLRVLVESRHKFALASGAQFTPLVDLGARHDGGDGNTGTGIEVGGGVHYFAPGLGLTVETRARVLLGRSDQDEWGIGGIVRLDPGADGQGLSLSLAPAYGDANANAQGMWENGVAGAGSAAGSSAKSTDPAATMAAEIAYGMSAAFGNGAFNSAGTLTPYSTMHFGDKNDYRMGLRWNASQRLNLDLSARHLDSDNRLTLEGKLRF